VTASWSKAERHEALARAEREGVDLLVIGGGINGAGVLRDAASRGLRALLVEREDFAAGTSSRSSKMIHGGIRYIAEGQLRVTRASCRERDLLLRLAPLLVRPLPFLFPAYEGSAVPLWQIRALLLSYSALANFRRTARTRVLRPAEVAHYSHDLRSAGLRGAGMYMDAQVDDARLVLESLRSARRLGADAVNHAEVFEFLRAGDGRIAGAVVRDSAAGRSYAIPAAVVVNAAGPAAERVRGLDRPVAKPELRPAKGIHLVIPRRRLHTEAAIVLEAPDGRHVFLCPWEDVLLIGTTDAFSDEIDEPVVRIEEVHYLLSAANEAFPRAGLTTNDLRSVFAGVRPLAAAEDEDTPSSKVSREDRIYQDPSGLISTVGGKLTTYRATGERIVDRVVRALPASRRGGVGPSRTAELPLREDHFDAAELAGALQAGYGVSAPSAWHLVRTYGGDAEALLAGASPELRETIGASRFLYAEIPWSFRSECPLTLCDLLERRMRLAIFADGQGLLELDRISDVAAQAAGWDAARREQEAAAYTAAVRRRYQIVAPGMTVKAPRGDAVRPAAA
jgi:glycerol-3-phosphate dehydrogenase